MGLEEFDLKELLGKGSFGSVMKCVRKSDGEIYAMKQIKIQKLKDKDKRNALNEIRFLASIEHPFVIGYKEAFYNEESETLCIVMEHANDSDLQCKIKKSISLKARVPEDDIWKVAYQVLEGLSRLHEANIIHRDIKPANIFFHNGIAKIGDLNVAKHLVDNFTMTQTGTPYYASPEVWSEEPYNFKSDVWSVGCVLYEMAMLKPPFRAENPDKLYRKIMLGEYDKISSPYSKELSAFITKLLTQNQKRRPSVSELLCHPQIMDKKFDLEEEEKEDRLLKTIHFPQNLKTLNKHLPGPKYETKAKTTKNIAESKGTCRHLRSQKQIVLNTVKSVLSEKNIMREKTKLQPLEDTKESTATRKPKVILRVGSQQLLF